MAPKLAPTIGLPVPAAALNRAALAGQAAAPAGVGAMRPEPVTETRATIKVTAFGAVRPDIDRAGPPDGPVAIPVRPAEIASSEGV